MAQGIFADGNGVQWGSGVGLGGSEAPGGSLLQKLGLGAGRVRESVPGVSWGG